MKIAEKIREEIEKQSGKHYSQREADMVELIIEAGTSHIRATTESMLEEHLFDFSRSQVEILDEIIESL